VGHGRRERGDEEHADDEPTHDASHLGHGTAETLVDPLRRPT
jgi:hypothetical protein